MKILAQFSDKQFPLGNFTHTRSIVRALVLNEKNEVAIHHLVRDDRFCPNGPQSYFETPGGGVDEGETLEMALHRECEEELGYTIAILQEIGEIDDDYNLIGRHNQNHYYLARRESYVGKHFVSAGDQMIKETLWLPIDEAIRRYESMPDDYVSGLVKQRELPILLLAKTLIK